MQKIGVYADLDYNNALEDTVSTLLVWESANCNSSLTIQKIRSVTLDHKSLKAAMVSKTSNPSPHNTPAYRWFLTLGERLKSRPGADWLHHVFDALAVEKAERCFLYLGCITYKTNIHHLGLEENGLLNLFLPLIIKTLFSIFSGT